LLIGIADCFHSAKEIRNKLNLNCRWLVIFVLRLAKALSKNNRRFRSVKVKVTHCVINSRRPLTATLS